MSCDVRYALPRADGAREFEGTIVFLHRLQRGAASRSYGIACAKLAGVPELVLARARVLLAELERGPTGGSLPSGTRSTRDQLTLFERDSTSIRADPHPMLEILRAVDIDRLTPLEALQLVAMLKRMAPTT